MARLNKAFLLLPERFVFLDFLFLGLEILDDRIFVFRDDWLVDFDFFLLLGMSIDIDGDYGVIIPCTRLISLLQAFIILLVQKLKQHFHHRGTEGTEGTEKNLLLSNAPAARLTI